MQINALGLKTGTTYPEGLTVTLPVAPVVSLSDLQGSEVSTPADTVFVRERNATYRLDPTDTTSTDNGGTVLVTAAGQRYKFTDIQISGALFAPVGNGTTDDAATLQKLLDAGNGKIITLEKKTYAVSARLTLPDNCVVDGNGATIKVLSDLPESLVNGNDVRPVFLMGNNTKLRNVSIDGNDKVCDGAVAVFKNNVVFENVEVYKYFWKYGCADIGCTNVQYDNRCYAHDTTKFGFHSYKSQKVTVTKCYSNRTFSGYYTGWAKDVQVFGCDFRNSTDVALDFEGGLNCRGWGNHIEGYGIGGLTIYSGNGEDSYTPKELFFNNNTVVQKATYEKYAIGGTITNVAPDATNAACYIYSMADGQTECGFSDNTIEVSTGVAFRTNQLASKTNTSAFFRKNTVKSSAGFFDTPNSENLAIEGNTFIGLPGAETVQNIFRDPHKGIFRKNVFRYTNAKADNHSVLIFTTGTFATGSPLIEGNIWENAEGWAMKVDLYLNGSLGPVLKANQFGETYTADGGLLVTANGSVKMVNQPLKIALPEGTTDLSSVGSLVYTGWSKAAGSLVYARPGYQGYSGTVHYLSNGEVKASQIIGGYGLTVTTSSTSITLSNSTGTPCAGRLDITVDSY